MEAQLCSEIPVIPWKGDAVLNNELNFRRFLSKDAPVLLFASDSLWEFLALTDQTSTLDCELLPISLVINFKIMFPNVSLCAHFCLALSGHCGCRMAVTGQGLLTGTAFRFLFCLFVFKNFASSAYRSQRFPIPALHCQTDLESGVRAVIIHFWAHVSCKEAVSPPPPLRASTLISKAAQICQSLQLFLQPPATAEACLQPATHHRPTSKQRD